MEQNSYPARMRRLVTLPQGSKIPVAYGCTECYWRYDPKGVSDVYEAATLLRAQVLFGIHDCQTFKVRSPETASGGKAKEHAA